MEEKKLSADYWRQLDFYNPAADVSANILIVGAGAIGSYATFALARLGVKNITVIDPDVVESHNIPNQFFPPSEGGIYKVNALSKIVKSIVPEVNLFAFPLRFQSYVESDYYRGPHTAIIVAVDNMQSRKDIWEWSKITSLRFLIDARIGGQFANIFSVILSQNKAKDIYEKSLYSDEEVPELPCSGQSVVDVSLSVAGAIAQNYRHYIAKTLVSVHTFYDFITPQAYGMAYYENNADDIVHTSEGRKV